MVRSPGRRGARGRHGPPCPEEGPQTAYPPARGPSRGPARQLRRVMARGQTCWGQRAQDQKRRRTMADQQNRGGKKVGKAEPEESEKHQPAREGEGTEVTSERPPEGQP